jgi:hypothetical protein
MLRASRIDSPTEVQESVILPLCRVGDDLVEQVLEAFALQDGLDVYFVGVREAEELGAG